LIKKKTFPRRAFDAAKEKNHVYNVCLKKKYIFKARVGKKKRVRGAFLLKQIHACNAQLTQKQNLQ
jgi:hypothetical protein